MICKNCKTALPNTAKVCKNCGQIVPTTNNHTLASTQHSDDDFEIVDDTIADEILEFKSRYNSPIHKETKKRFSYSKKIVFPFTKEKMFIIGGGLFVLLLIIIFLIGKNVKNNNTPPEPTIIEDTAAKESALSYEGVTTEIYTAVLELIDTFYSEEYITLIAAEFQAGLIETYGETPESLSGEQGCDVLIALPDVTAKKKQIQTLFDKDATETEIALRNGLVGLYSLVCEAAYGLAVDETIHSDFYNLSCHLYLGFDPEGFYLPGIAFGDINDGMEYLYQGFLSRDNIDHLENSWRYQQLTHSFFKDIIIE